MLTRHYGFTVNSDSPVTGVVQNNRIEFLDEEMFGDGAIDLAWVEHRENCKGQCEHCHCNHDGEKCFCGHKGTHEYEPQEDEHEFCGPESSGDVLIGSWKLVDGKYEPDETGDYAAIVRESVTQVVWSKTTKKAALCSPCYPGQADLDTPGQYLAYDLPWELYGSERT